VEISRPTATKLFNRDIDLKQTEKVSIMSLPKEIQDELMSIYKRIAELL
jgi:hypothetical protein